MDTKATTPTLEERRQWEIHQNLLRSRNDPPLAEIWSGMALNNLLLAIQKVQSGRVQGPIVPLDPDLLAHVKRRAPAAVRPPRAVERAQARPALEARAPAVPAPEAGEAPAAAQAPAAAAPGAAAARV